MLPSDHKQQIFNIVQDSSGFSKTFIAFLILVSVAKGGQYDFASPIYYEWGTIPIKLPSPGK